MAEQLVALNIGSQRITMAVFAQGSKKQLTLSRYTSRNVLADPATEATRMILVTQVIGEMIEELRVKGSIINYSIAGQSVFLRFIKLPNIEGTDFEELIQFEAQQHVPFPLDEVVWDYHLLPADGLEREAVLVAIKADILNSLNDDITAYGVKTGSVDCALTSLYNAYKDSYPDEYEPVMLIDIGAKSTDLIYTEGGKFFTRSVAAGGVLITTAIAREFNISFEEAENQKIVQGMVSMDNGQAQGLDPAVAHMGSIIRNAMTRMASEISRTTNHYRAQVGGNAPTKAYLCGGSALLPYTKEFLEERLGIPILFFNPLHGVGVGPQIDPSALSAEALLLGGVIGTALNAVKRTDICINLEPSAVAKQRAAQAKVPKIALAAVLALVGAAIPIAAYSSQLSTAKETEKNLQKHIRVLEPTAKEIAKLESTKSALDAKLKVYNELALVRYGLVDIITRLMENTQSDQFWITDFIPVANFDFTVRGQMSGTHITKDDFIQYTSSSITQPTEEAASGGRKGTAGRPKQYSINAIKLVGVARGGTQEGTKFVQGIKKKITDMEANAETGAQTPFTFKDDKGRALEDNQFFKTENPKDGATFAVPFTIILPLKQPLPVQAQQQQQ